MKIFTVHLVEVSYEDENTLEYFLTFEDAYEYAREQVKDYLMGRHEKPLPTMEEAHSDFYAPKSFSKRPKGYTRIYEGISIGWVQVQGDFESAVYNVDDGVFERDFTAGDDDEVCDAPAAKCATCDLRDYCGNAKEG